MTGLWPRGFLSLTAAMPLRVVEGASKFIEGASLYKTIQPPCGRGNAFPLWWLAPPPSPNFVVGLWVFSNGALSLQESIERFILPPLAGEVRRSRIGGGERSEPVSRMLFMPYDTESKSRNADFISIPKGETTHYILRVAIAPSPSVVTDSLDFQVADAPLQIQFA